MRTKIEIISRRISREMYWLTPNSTHGARAMWVGGGPSRVGIGGCDAGVILSLLSYKKLLYFSFYFLYFLNYVFFYLLLIFLLTILLLSHIYAPTSNLLCFPLLRTLYALSITVSCTNYTCNLTLCNDHNLSCCNNCYHTKYRCTNYSLYNLTLLHNNSHATYLYTLHAIYRYNNKSNNCLPLNLLCYSTANEGIKYNRNFARKTKKI